MKKIMKNKIQNSVIANFPNLTIKVVNDSNICLESNLEQFIGVTSYGNSVVCQTKNEVIEINGQSYTLNLTLSERANKTKPATAVKTYTRAEIRELIKNREKTKK